MPWLPLYADSVDLDEIRKWLNSEESIGFLVSNEPKQWVAVKNLEAWTSSCTALWHVPSGPLPLLAADASAEDGEIVDPWSAWTERRTGADPTTPYFGAGHSGVIWFNVRSGNGHIGLSSFEWIGNHYRIIGSAANPDTEKWWRRLGRRIKRNAVRVPRSGSLDGENPEIWALPSALSAIKAGVERDSNPS